MVAAVAAVMAVVAAAAEAAAVAFAVGVGVHFGFIRFVDLLQLLRTQQFFSFEINIISPPKMSGCSFFD